MTPDESFVETLLEDMDSNKFRFDVLLAIVAGTFWLKVIFSLRLTKTFGPLLKIIQSMLSQIFLFTILWVLQLIFFACIGFMLFSDLEAYSHYYDTLIMLFEAALGEWDMTIYEGLGTLRYFGVVFHMFFLIINLVLLLNLIIAILTSTYEQYAIRGLALYHDEIIESIPYYKSNKLYGSLISMFPPLNVVSSLFLPFFMACKDDNKIEKLNNVLLHIGYAPLLIVFTIAFILLSVILLPLAFICAWLDKWISLLTIQKKWKIRLAEAFFFTIFGVPMMVLNTIVDVLHFWRHLFLFKMERLSIIDIPDIPLNFLRELTLLA